MFVATCGCNRIEKLDVCCMADMFRQLINPCWKYSLGGIKLDSHDLIENSEFLTDVLRVFVCELVAGRMQLVISTSTVEETTAFKNQRMPGNLPSRISLKTHPNSKLLWRCYCWDSFRFSLHCRERVVGVGRAAGVGRGGGGLKKDLCSQHSSVWS